MDEVALIAGAVSGVIVGMFYLMIAIRYARVGNGYTTGAILLLLSAVVILYAAGLYGLVAVGVLGIDEYPRLIRPAALLIVSLPAGAIVWLLDESSRRG